MQEVLNVPISARQAGEEGCALGPDEGLERREEGRGGERKGGREGGRERGKEGRREGWASERRSYVG